jgi:TetR/AcrR family transcriptional repressor of uid operon
MSCCRRSSGARRKRSSRRWTSGAGAYDDPVDRLVAGFVFFIHSLSRQELGWRLIRTDPEIVMPMLTTDAAAPIALARDYVAGKLASSGLPLNGDPTQLAEMLVRLSHSLMLTPGTSLPVDDDDALAALARATLVPLVLAPEPAPR